MLFKMKPVRVGENSGVGPVQRVAISGTARVRCCWGLTWPAATRVSEIFEWRRDSENSPKRTVQRRATVDLELPRAEMYRNCSNGSTATGQRKIRRCKKH